MRFSLRYKFAFAAAGVAFATLISGLWFVDWQHERQMVHQIADRLALSEVNLVRMLEVRRDFLQSETRIIVRDPRFFASVIEKDPRTVEETARRFQTLTDASLLLVCDEGGSQLAHLDKNGKSALFSWPISVPPASGHVIFGERAFSLSVEPIVVGGQVIGYLALGSPVDSELAREAARVSGVDVVLFDSTRILGATGTVNQRIASQLESRFDEATAAGEGIVAQQLTVDGERHLLRTGSLSRDGNLSYALLLSLDDRLQPLVAASRDGLVLAALISVTFSILVAVVIAGQVTRRVPALVRSVESVASGNYEDSVPCHGTDELSTLAHAVDRMRVELAAQIQAIEAANAEKLSAARLAAIGKMASGIIHDFKNPMQIIRTAADMMGLPQLDDTKRQEYIGKVYGELDRMVAMAQDLLLFARGERRMAYSNVRFNEFINDLVADIRPLSQHRGIDIALINKAVCDISIDAEKIRRCLSNIINNAMEVLSAKGRIEIQTECSNAFLTVRVIDNGPGIPAEIAETLFEPFVTVGKREGTGLGLAIAKKVVDDHHGTIAVQSALGQGTTFEITLPRTVTTGQKTSDDSMEPHHESQNRSHSVDRVHTEPVGTSER